MRLVCNPSNFDRPIAIVGGGGTSTSVLDMLGDYKRLVALIVDNDIKLFGNKIETVNLNVNSFEKLQEFEGEILIACAGNDSLCEQLDRLGVAEVNYYYNYLANVALYDSWKDNDDIFNIVSDFADTKSEESLKAIVASIKTKDFNSSFNLVVPRPFFGSSGFEIRQGEHLIDIGSYQGRHFKAFSLAELHLIETVTCIEPDQSNNDFLRNIFSEDPKKDRLWKSKLSIINKAIKSEVGFGVNAGGGISNSVSIFEPNISGSYNAKKVENITLDDLIYLNPTLITIDIEGDEMELLKGGINLILGLKPRMAISTYHKPDHLELVYSFFQKVPGEKQYRFRLHDFGYMDQVLYIEFI